ncbi:GNAT family N-acetyltransferase [Streptomyces sp. NPDC051784]|uniref:GNAT family N-acetyltransferase n=1 Tax=Streptomyces sp. NPDC051784 TaxID=3155805 RepID=UPI003436323F
MLTLTQIAQKPDLLTRRPETHGIPDVVIRPLANADCEQLGRWLAALTPETRRFSTFDGYDLAAARELCDAIGRYDKLRLVLEEVPSGRIVGLLEFSLALTATDIARYQDAGIRITERTVCRFGATLADDYQGRGIGTMTFPHVREVARLLGKSRIILWGGVRADNSRAIRYYEKCGFHDVGPFTEADGSLSLDMMLDLSPGPDARSLRARRTDT